MSNKNSDCRSQDSSTPPRTRYPGLWRYGVSHLWGITICVALTVAAGLVALAVRAQSPEPVAPATSTQPAAGLLDQAQQLRDQLKWDEALAILRTAAGQDSDRAAAATAQVRVGRYLVQMGRSLEAIPELQRVAVDFSDQPHAIGQATVGLVEAYGAQGRGDEARATAQTLVNSPLPEFQAWGHVKLAEMEIFGGSRSDAGSRLQTVINTARDQYPEPANWARIKLAELSFHQFSYAEALRLCAEVDADHSQKKANDSQAAWALIWRANTLQRQGSPDAAVVALQMASALTLNREPEVASIAEFDLGEIYREWRDAPVGRDNHVEALQHYETALQQAEKGNVSADSKGQCRLQVGSEYRHLNMRNKGIAILRLGISDPSKMGNIETLLADRLRSFMDKDEAESWQKYLIDPANTPDPTAAFVIAKTGQPGATPKSAVPDSPFRRWYWLARLYQEERRFAEAAQTFDQALTYATTDREFGEGLTWKAAMSRRLGRPLKEAKAIAANAVRYWMQYVVSTPNEPDAHYAIDMIASSYKGIGCVEEMLTALQAAVASLSPQTQPSRACFARFRLAQEYCGSGKDDEALALVQESIPLFLDREFPDHSEEICVRLCFTAGELLQKRGDLAGAARAVDEVARRWPDRYADAVASFRRELSQ